MTFSPWMGAYPDLKRMGLRVADAMFDRWIAGFPVVGIILLPRVPGASPAQINCEEFTPPLFRAYSPFTAAGATMSHPQCNDMSVPL